MPDTTIAIHIPSVKLGGVDCGDIVDFEEFFPSVMIGGLDLILRCGILKKFPSVTIRGLGVILRGAMLKNTPSVMSGEVCGRNLHQFVKHDPP